MRIEDHGLSYEYLMPQRMIIVRHGQGTTEAEWDAYIAFLGTLQAVDDLRVLGYADCDPPSAAIQRRIGAVSRGKPWRIALVSSSAAFRFAVSAFSLINKGVRGFHPKDLDGALRHLGCEADERRTVSAVLDRLATSATRAS